MSLPAALVAQIRNCIASAEWTHARLFDELVADHGEALGVRPGERPPDALIGTLHDAIEAEIAAQLEAMRGWPPTTDNDRLQAAFEALEAQGLVAFGPAGFTLQEGTSLAALRCVALEARGTMPRGNCFFHRQDLYRALEGSGLSLAFASYDSDAEAETAAIGRVVVDALRHAGLNPGWNGSGRTRIHLPSFVWRARLRPATEEQIRDFLESWEIERRARPLPPPAALLGELAERAGDWFAENVDYGPRLFARLHAHSEHFVAAELEREAGWTEATTNDRLAAAFEELRARGVIANAGMGTTAQDAWAYVGIERGRSERPHRGAVLFHDEDVIDAIEGRELHLGFGAFEPAARNARSAELAREILEVLASHGVAARWSGSVHERIAVLPFAWRLRRATSAPPHERAASGPTPRASLWKRFFGSEEPAAAAPVVDPSVFPSLRRRFVERGHAALVRAPRSTAGFDLRRSRRLRSDFEALGSGLRAQACHLGLPWAFVPLDHYAMLAAMPAIENLIDEAVPLVERGARSQ